MQLKTTSLSLESQARTMNFSDGYCRDIRQFENWRIQNKCKVNAETLNKYFSILKSQGLLSSTLARKKQSIKKIVILGYEAKGDEVQKAIAEKFFRSIKFQIPEKTINREAVPTDEQIETLFKYMTNRNVQIVKSLQQSGARVSEILSVRLKDCHSFGNETEITLRETKNRRDRTIAIKTSLFKEIQVVFQGKVYLFESRNGKRLNRRNLFTAMKKAGERAADDVTDSRERRVFLKIHPHSLRHAYATNALHETDPTRRLDIYEVKEILGHSNIAITTQFYAHNKPSLKKRLARFESRVPG